jgi:geranylgeranyl diphosphate synthase, type II
VDAQTTIESALEAALRTFGSAGSPPLLGAAVRHAVFPGGARVRPQLCLAVSSACGRFDGELARAAAAGIEMLHCASLVHDDLPCFDDADLRRDRASVHRAFGEPLAVLAGDALIVGAFGVVIASGSRPGAMGVLSVLHDAAGAPAGLVAGQAWESEPSPPLRTYHRAKTGALFRAATECGAISAGEPASAWRPLGDKIGEAYQVADDLRDLAPDLQHGKTSRRDSILDRPSAVGSLGVDGAANRLRELLSEAMDAIPLCAGRVELQSLVRRQAKRLELATVAPSAA